MNTHTPDTAEKGKAIAHELRQKHGNAGGHSFADNRPEALALGTQIQLMSGSVQAQRLETVQRMANGSTAVVQRARILALADLKTKNLEAMIAYAVGTVKPWLDEAVAENSAHSAIALQQSKRLQVVMDLCNASLVKIKAGEPTKNTPEVITTQLAHELTAMVTALNTSIAGPAPVPVGPTATVVAHADAPAADTDEKKTPAEAVDEPEYMKFNREKEAKKAKERYEFKAKAPVKDEPTAAGPVPEHLKKYLNPKVLRHMAGEHKESTGAITGGHLLLAMQSQWGADLTVTGTPSDRVWAGAWNLKSRKKKRGVAPTDKESTFFPQAWTLVTLQNELRASGGMAGGRVLKPSGIHIEAKGDTFFPVPGSGAAEATGAAGKAGDDDAE